MPPNIELGEVGEAGEARPGDMQRVSEVHVERRQADQLGQAGIGDVA